MRFDPEALPELRKSRNPAERKNEAFAARAALITRSPMPQDEWIERYDEAFYELVHVDEVFRLLTRRGSETRALTALQDMLDARTGA